MSDENCKSPREFIEWSERKRLVGRTVDEAKGITAHINRQYAFLTRGEDVVVGNGIVCVWCEDGVVVDVTQA